MNDKSQSSVGTHSSCGWIITVLQIRILLCLLVKKFNRLQSKAAAMRLTVSRDLCACSTLSR